MTVQTDGHKKSKSGGKQADVKVFEVVELIKVFKNMFVSVFLARTKSVFLVQNKET